MNICKFLKRSLSLLLVLMMCVSLMSLSAFAANEETPTQYACGLEEHEHTDECYEIQTVDTLICDSEESEGHQHDSSCYETQTTETEEQVLTCDEEHEHTEDCYAVQTVTVEEEVLTCQQAEAEGHTHSEDCYETTTVTTLACGKEEHTHTAECVAEETAVEEIPSGIGVFADAMYAIMDLQNADAEDEEIFAAVETAWDAYNVLSEGEKANEMVAMMYEALVAFEQTMPLATATPTTVQYSSFPRGGNGGNYGRPGGTLQNGKVVAKGNGTNWSIHWRSSDKQIVYCIEPGVGSDISESMNEHTESDGLPKLTDQQIALIGRIFASNNSYTGAVNYSTGSTGQCGVSQSADATFAKAIATQLLIWEVVVEERNANFDHVLTTGHVPVVSSDGQTIAANSAMLSPSCPIGTLVMEAYQNIVTDVQKSSKDTTTLPSICRDSVWKLTQTNDSYDADSNRFTRMLTDSKGVLNNFTIKKLESTGIASKTQNDNNSVTIKMAPDSSATFSVTRTFTNNREGLVVYTSNNGKQAVATTNGVKQNETLTGTFKVQSNSAPTGSLTITKNVNVNDGSAISQSFTFTIKGADSNNSSVTKTATINYPTDKTATVNDLPVGNYTVTEDTANVANYDWAVVENGVSVTVNPGQTATTTITNNYTRQTGNLKISKTIEGATNGRENDSFTFNITISDLTGIYDVSSNVDGLAKVTFTYGTAIVTLKGGEYAIINGLPAGVAATVTEVGAGTDTAPTTDGYVASTTSQTSTIPGNGTTTAAFTNTRHVSELQVTKEVSWDSRYSQAPKAGAEFTFKVTLGGDSDTAQTGNTYAGPGVYTLTTTLTEEDIQKALDKADNEKTATCAVQTISGIPAGTTYTVEEVTDNMTEGFTQNGYTNENGTISLSTTTSSTVKNRYFKTVLTSIDGYKDWVGVPENLWPESITVALYQDGTEFETRNVCAPENGSTRWTYSWSNLPQYKAENEAYQYTVREISINYDENSVYKADAREDNTNIIRVRSNVLGADGNYEIVGGWLITVKDDVNVVNQWLPASELGETSFTIRKLDSLTETPIEGVTFKLEKTGNENVADGNTDRILTTDESGTVTFSYLTDGTYTLTETKVAEGYQIEDGVNVGRTWTINIVKDGLATVKEVYDNDILGENTWNWKPVNSDGDDIGILTITNAPIMGRISVTKTLDLDGVTDGITGEPADKVFTFEVWATEDVLGADLTKPVATLEVKMGQTATTELLRYGTYIVKEVGNPEELTDYKWQSVTYTQGSIDSATEEMVNNLAEAVTDALNEVLDRETEEDVTTESANTVMVGEQDVTFAVTATNHYERNLGELSISKTVQGDLGNQNKEWHFTVTLTSPEEYVQLAEQYEVTYSANKSVADEEAEDAEEVEPDYLTFTAQEDGTYVSAEIVLKHGETATIQGIPVGTTYKVTEAEASKDGYSTSATDDTGVIVTVTTEAKFYNSRWSVPTTSLTVNKVWEDDGHEDERPDSIQVQLYQNGNAYGNPVTLNADNGWSQRWTGLSTNGAWTVEELNVPHGYTVTMEQSGTVVTITNTYEEEEEEDLDDPDVPLAEMPDDPEEPDDSDDSDDSDNSDGPDEEFLDDPDVPLAGVPDMPEEEELDDPDVPLAEMPGAPEEEELDDPDVPLAEMPGVPEEEDQEELEELTDLDVPLAEVPKTGDRSGLWYALSAAAAAGLLGLTAVERKKREED